ncbi:MAG: CRISPR-associated endonuclease Cas1 [Paludibacter sp. 47-17]|nr:MAG: CRISPR-associated endonuclease Cas1 [Paludibacter sp. 47-17]
MNDPLFETLCRKQTLYTAWLKVKEKNTVGGIDQKTVEDYARNVDQYLEELSQKLIAGTYIQQPYREVFIPKKENEKRRLGLLTVNDKVVQTAVSQIITPIFEKSFLPVSYAYRENKSAVKAIRQVQHLVKIEHYTWLASCDIDNFFDNIPHAPLFGRLNAFLKSPGITELMKMFVMMGSVNYRKQWKNTVKGIPQGSVVSPILANFYLYQLDKLMMDKKYGFVRYADDFIILGKTEAQANEALNDVVQVITKQLSLTLNEGSAVVPVSDGFDFLGIHFKDGNIDLSETKFNRLREKLHDAAETGQGFISSKLTETIQGIANFYGKLVSQEKLNKLDIEIIKLLKKRWIRLNPNQTNHLPNQLQTIMLLAEANVLNKTAFLHQYWGIKEKSKDKTKTKKSIQSREAVLSRKHEYRKLESSGFDLAITQPGFFLGKKDHDVTVKYQGKLIREIPFINLKNITILCDGVTLSSNLIKSCAENKISIDFLGDNGAAYAIIVNPTFVNADIGIAQLQAYTDHKSFYLIRKFVTGKINNQLNLIKYYGKYYLSKNQELKTLFPDFSHKMKKLCADVENINPQSLDEYRLKLFAVEGQASSAYWDMVKVLIANKMIFNGRERQGARDLVNCMLNYGYGILYARITEAILKTGLNPCLSYLHKPDGNRLSLVFDLIEEFRQQAVDRVVIALIMKNKNLRELNGILDDYTRKTLSQKVIDRMNNFELFRKKECRFFEIMFLQARALVNFLTDNTKEYKPYNPKW